MDNRQVIEIKKVNGKNTTYYKCSYPICEAKTANEFCRHHSVKYNTCTYPSCYNKTRSDRCSRHKEKYLLANRTYCANRRARIKEQKNQQAQIVIPKVINEENLILLEFLEKPISNINNLEPFILDNIE